MSTAWDLYDEHRASQLAALIEEADIDMELALSGTHSTSEEDREVLHSAYKELSALVCMALDLLSPNRIAS